MRELFGVFARRISDISGSAYTFIFALGMVVLWGLSGPLFNYSSRWQLVINTGTTIVTFLMVFLIQNAQNRDQIALQLKLDELLKAVTGARTGFVDLEDLTEDELKALREQFQRLAEKHKDDVTLVTASTDDGTA